MIKGKVGKDIVSSVISKIPIEFHLRTLKGKKYSFCGPNTNLDERLNPDETPKEWSKPINAIDSVCLNHDLAYKHADEGIGSRHEADKTMLDELNAIKNKDLSFTEKLAKYATKGVIWTKYKLGLGLNSPEAEELHKPIRRKFKRRRVMVFNIDDIWSADLDISKANLSKQNKSYKYLLNIIDIFSKYAYSIPLKTKSSEEVTAAFDKLFKFSGRKPNKLWTDNGGEFVNNKFKDFLKTHNIELYHVFNEGKACVVERFNRTLGEMIQKYMTSNHTSRYVDVLQTLINEYNNKFHTSIKMSPVQGSKTENTLEVYRNLYSDIRKNSVKPKFKIGDRVRIYKYKNTFEKGYKTNWTKEIFVIDEINKTNPITYKIRDLDNEQIIGSFYYNELQKTIY